MRTLINYLPAIACGAMMLLICIRMMRNMHKDHDGSDDSGAQREIGELRDEIALLKAERALEKDRVTVDG